MDKLILAVFFVFLCAAPVFGDEVDEGLSATATTALKAGTRSMISAGIRSGDAIGMTRAMMENRFEEQQVLRAQEIVILAQKQGLPVGPIITKAHEGMAKRVQQENIIKAMEQVRSRYDFSCQQAGELTQGEAQRNRIMEQIAECVAAGMTEHDVGRLMFELKYRMQGRSKEEADGLATETFRTVKDIARQRVSSIQTTDLGLEALKHHYDMQKMQKLQQSFIKDARDNSAQIVAEAYFNAIKQDRNLENVDFSHKKGPVKTGLGIEGSGGSGGWSAQGGSAAGGSGRGSGGSGGGGGSRGRAR